MSPFKMMVIAAGSFDKALDIWFEDLKADLKSLSSFPLLDITEEEPISIAGARLNRINLFLEAVDEKLSRYALRYIEIVELYKAPKELADQSFAQKAKDWKKEVSEDLIKLIEIAKKEEEILQTFIAAKIIVKDEKFNDVIKKLIKMQNLDYDSFVLHLKDGKVHLDESEK